MKKILIILLGLFLATQNAFAASGAQTEASEQNNQSQKKDINRSKEISTTNKKSNETKDSIESAIQRLRNEGLRRTTSSQLSMIREKSNMLSTKKHRNLASEILQEAYLVLKKTRYGDDFTSLLENLTPSTFGINSGGSMIDTIKAQMIQNWATTGQKVSLVGGSDPTKIKIYSVKAIYLGAWLADCLEEIRVSGEIAEYDTILSDIHIFLKRTARDFVNIDYRPADQRFKKIQKEVWTNEVYFGGSLDKFRVGPAFVDISNGFLAISTAGRSYLSNQAFAGVSANIEYSEGYTTRDTMNDLSSIEQFSELSKSISSRVAKLKSQGRVQEANNVQKKYVAWAKSIDNSQTFSEKLTLLLNLLGIS
jgi:hypothetical protein